MSVFTPVDREIVPAVVLLSHDVDDPALGAPVIRKRKSFGGGLPSSHHSGPASAGSGASASKASAMTIADAIRLMTVPSSRDLAA